jgi:cobalt/nickel transport system permease protein
VHVLDGYVPTWVVAGGFAGAAALTAATLPALARASAPRVAMLTSAFFVSSLALKVPVGPTSVHLSLLGLVGVILGRAAFPAILVGLALQLLLFQHGGVTTLGVNACVMGLGALSAAACYQLPRPRRAGVRAGLAAAVGTCVALSLYGGVLLTAGRALESVAWATLGFHAPVIVLEALVTASAVSFLDRVQPGLVREQSQRLSAAQAEESS